MGGDQDEEYEWETISPLKATVNIVAKRRPIGGTPLEMGAAGQLL